MGDVWEGDVLLRRILVGGYVDVSVFHCTNGQMYKVLKNKDKIGFEKSMQVVYTTQTEMPGHACCSHCSRCDGELIKLHDTQKDRAQAWPRAQG